jgi:phage-related protein
MEEIAAISGNLAGSKLAKGFAKGVGKLSVMAPAIGAVGAAGLSGAANLTTLAGSLTQVLGLAALGPAALGGLATSGLALGLALKNIKTRFADLAPAWEGLQQIAEHNFFYFAEKPIRNMVKNLFPAFKNGVENIAASWGEVAGAGADALSKNLGNGVLDRMLENTRVAVLGLKPAMEPVIRAFSILGDIGSGYLPRFTAWISKLADQFGAFIDRAQKTGMIQQWIEGGINSLKDMWSIVKSVLGIFGALQSAAAESGNVSTLHGLAEGLKRISDVMNGPVFQKALTTIFAGAGRGAESLMKAIGPIGDALVRIQDPLARFLDLGGQIVGGVLTMLANALGNPAFVDGLNTFLVGLNVGLQLVAPLLPVITTALGAFIAALAPAIASILPGLATTFALMAMALAAAAPVISGILTALGPMLPILIPLGLAAMGLYKALMLWKQISTIIELLKSITAVQAIWNLVTAMWPGFLLIALIIAVIAALVWFFTQTEEGKAMWASFTQWLTDCANAFVQWWTGVFWPMVMAIWNAFMSYLQVVWTMWSTIWQAIWTLISNVWNAICGIIETAWNLIVAIFSGKTAEAWALVFQLGQQILDFFGNAGTWLLDAGRAIIQGLIDGISGMMGAVGDAIGGVMDFIGSFLPHSPAKRGEFSGKGWTPFRGKALIGGFADGIVAGTKSGEEAAATATTAISNQLHPVISPANALSAPQPRGGSATADWAAQPAPVVNDKPAGDRNLNVTVNNPAPDPPSKSIQKTYSKLAYLGLDGGEAA